MTEPALRLRHLSFLGPVKPPASISFAGGLNVIYGASNTGKSFIVDTIDFMLGGRGPLRDIPEAVGYDRVFLAMETSSGECFTLVRSLQGGPFQMYEGLHTDRVPDGEGKELADQHNDRGDDNLSSFLLAKINLAKKRIRKNRHRETQSLSFRNLARLAIVNEEEIIQQRSPLSDGTYTADTANTSVFKLLLTAVDDSALTSTRASTPEEHSREGQLELLDQLIADMKRQVRDLAGSPAELESQMERLDETIVTRGQQLAISEGQYREAATRRRELLNRLDEGNNRLTEIGALLERFALLEKHYESDVSRLNGIAEAGSLFSALGEASCPLCGALPEHHRLTDECDGNVDGVVTAAHAEIAKIQMRSQELRATVKALDKERKSFERRLPKIEEDVRVLSRQIENILAPNLRQTRTGYSELADKRGAVREALGFHKTLKDLEDRKTNLLSEDAPADGNQAQTEAGLSTSTADKFSSLVLSILQQWHFPQVERVHFELKTRDLVINGKNRVSYGKGLRAITQAAFTIGLMEFCRQNGTSHPGFAILDSPLLSYREPEGQDDDLRGTDLNDHFYTFLASLGTDRQIIIVENTDPPAAVQMSPYATKFTGNDIGRFGLFPTEPAP